GEVAHRQCRDQPPVDRLAAGGRLLLAHLDQCQIELFGSAEIDAMARSATRMAPARRLTTAVRPLSPGPRGPTLSSQAPRLGHPPAQANSRVPSARLRSCAARTTNSTVAGRRV